MYIKKILYFNQRITRKNLQYELAQNEHLVSYTIYAHGKVPGFVMVEST